MTDRAALDFLDAVLGRIPGLGTAGQAAINRDPRHRSPVELEVVEAAKRPLVEHPIRSEDGDRTLPPSSPDR